MSEKTEIESRTQDVLMEKCTFQELGLNSKILEGLQTNGFEIPSPIQYKAIPIGLCGFDLVIQAKSGTGKTLVFSVICLESIQTQIADLQALILAPTREIAVQTQQLLQQIGAQIEKFKTEYFVGGLSIDSDRKKLLGCHVAVGAPGRVKHLLVNRVLNPNRIKLLILDEADQLITQNFIEDIKYIYSCLPSKKQIIAASATYSSYFSKFMKIFMRYPSVISPKHEVPVLLGVKQFATIVQKDESDVLNISEVVRLLSQISFKQCIIFSNTKSLIDQVSVALKKLNWPSECLSSDHNQTTRLAVLNKLKEFKCRILVTTDLTARGVDAENVNFIINLEVPLSHATYLHRIGRAGRYGTQGIAVTIIKDDKEVIKFKNILCKIGGNDMHVDILPHDKIPNLWNKNIQFEFNKIWGSKLLETSQNLYINNKLHKSIEKLNSSMNKTNSYESANIASTKPKSEFLESNNSQIDLQIKERTETQIKEKIFLDIDNDNSKSETNSIFSFEDLQNDMNMFIKNNTNKEEISTKCTYSKSHIEDDSLFDKSSIYCKLLDNLPNECCTVQDLDSLLKEIGSKDLSTTNCNTSNLSESISDLSLEDITSSKTNNAVIETSISNITASKNISGNDNNTNDCDNILDNIDKTAVKSKTDFITKLKIATSDIDFEVEDSLKVNKLLKNKTEQERKINFKPIPINKKQLDEDRAFLDLIKSKVSKEKVMEKNQTPKNEVNSVTNNFMSDENVAEEFRKAMLNVDCDTFKDNDTLSEEKKPKKLHAFKNCESDLSKKSTYEEKSSNIREKESPESNIYLKKESDKIHIFNNILNNQTNECSSFQDSTKIRKEIESKDLVSNNNPLISDTKLSQSNITELISDLSINVTSSPNIDKETNDVNSNVLISVTPKSKIISNNKNDRTDFITKLKEATADIDFEVEDSLKVNKILKVRTDHENKVHSKPKPVTKEQLDEDKAFLDLIKKNIYQESVDKIVNSFAQTRNICKSKLAMHDEHVAEEFRKAMSGVDCDTFKNNENNSIKKNEENVYRVKLQATRKCNPNIPEKDLNSPNIKSVQYNEINNTREMEYCFINANDNTAISSDRSIIIEKSITEREQLKSITEGKSEGSNLEGKSKDLVQNACIYADINTNDSNVNLPIDDLLDHKLLTQNYAGTHELKYNEEQYKSKMPGGKICNYTCSKPRKTLDERKICSETNYKRSPVSHSANENECMFAHNKWNQNWMQQLWQINNYVVQNNFNRNTYLNLYHNK